MKAQLERICYSGTSFAAFERVAPEFPFYWHYHPEFELTLILDSSGQRFVGDSIGDYEPGDLVLLGPDLPHSWRSGPVKSRAQDAHKAIVFHFRQNFLGEQFFAAKELQAIAALLKRAACGLAFGHTGSGREAASRLVELERLPPIQRLLLLVSVLSELSEETHAEKLSTVCVRPICRVKDERRIDSICRHLEHHFNEQIDFLELAKLFHMDQASLCRFFKRATGRTMTRYLNEYRVGAAAQLLVQTDASLLDIAFQVGFENYSNFHRQFKRIKGYSPRLLRQELISDSTRFLLQN